MLIHNAHGQPVGEWIDDGKHRPFRAPGCPLQALTYDESQMKESDAETRARRGLLEYEC